MNKLHYGEHKWLTLLINFCNNRLVLWLRERPVLPNNLCELLWVIISSIILTIFGVIIIVLSSFIVLNIFIIWFAGLSLPISQFFVPPANSEQVIMYLFWAFFSYLLLGGAISNSLDRESIWRKPLLDFFKKEQDENSCKQPSLIVEFLNGIKNKYCPTITYGDDNNGTW
jgi:hypothetical protein